MPLRNERSPEPVERIELIVTARAGLVWSGQPLEHNAQRQEAPTRTAAYSAITIEGKNISSGSVTGRVSAYMSLLLVNESATTPYYRVK